MDNSHDDQDSRAFFADLASLSDDYFSALQQSPAAEVVSRLAQEYWDEQRTIALRLGDDRRINVAARTIKTIGIYYCQIACGGADRVVLDQAKMLSDLGYHIVLITETPLEDTVRNELPNASCVLLSSFFWDTNKDLYPQRAQALEHCLVEYAIDLVIYNQSLSPLMLWDLLLIKAHGASCIAWAHGVFTFPLAEIGKVNGVDLRIADMPFVLRLVDAIVCANRADRIFWSHFNTTVYQTTYTPKISIDSRQSKATTEHPHVVWIGRFSSEKQPLDAIQIMGEVVKTIPDAILDMIGPYDDEWFAKTSSLIEELSLADNVILHGRQNDMAPYYREANLFLHTSQSESFCLVLFEAKAAGIPCVMYELPYLELAERGEAGGVLGVRQGDVKTAAALCTQVLSDEDLAQKLSEAAMQDIEPLLAYDPLQFWRNVISSLGEKREVKDLDEDSRLVLNTLCDAYVQALGNLNSINLKNEVTIAKLHQDMNGLHWEIDKLHENLDEQQRVVECVREDLHALEDSTTLRVGRTLLWLPTHLKDVIRHRKS